jgi:hypothetical protein
VESELPKSVGICQGNQWVGIIQPRMAKVKRLRKVFFFPLMAKESALSAGKASHPSRCAVVPVLVAFFRAFQYA